jgi:demethylspheroidene O-methyltransferase
MFGALHDRLIAWRNRIVADPRFQSWAAQAPFTRLVARRQSIALFDLCAGFVYSQVLRACIETKLLEALAQGPRSEADLAQESGLGLRAFHTLSEAAIALKLMQRTSTGALTLGMKGAALLGNDWIGKFILHHDALYDDLRLPLDVVERRARHLKSFWGYAGTGAGAARESDDSAAAYSALMAASQVAVASEILRAHDFSSHRVMLDIGGGDGSFIRAVKAKHPQLTCHLFDLPAVAELARAALGATDVTIHAGDFRRDALPPGADLVTLIRITHDHDDAVVEALFARIHGALPDGGTLLIGEPMAGDRATARVASAYFGLYFAAMGQGRPRTASEVCTMLRGAGFAKAYRIATSNPLIASVVIAKKSLRESRLATV